tara:strand:+ start:747 stop:1145 length:399 start_codon:yes stop_codon:yes gene_type:complete
MEKMKILQSWYPTMLPSYDEKMHWKEITIDEVKQLISRLGFESCILRENIATIVSNLLDMDIYTKEDDCHVFLKRGEQFVLAQYHGPYLGDQEEMPPNGRMFFWFATVSPIQILVAPKTNSMTLRPQPQLQD